MKDKATAPGVFLKILSVIPFFNIIALACMGMKVKRAAHIWYAVLYGVLLLTLDMPQGSWTSTPVSVALWVIPMVQFWAGCAMFEKRRNRARRSATPRYTTEAHDQRQGAASLSTAPGREDTAAKAGASAGSAADKPASAAHAVKNAADEVRAADRSAEERGHSAAVNYSSITVDGTKEKKETIPQSAFQSYTGTAYSGLPSYQKFLQDMRHYADVSGDKAEFTPFVAYWPTYDSMNFRQKAWYLYWRTQVREKQYPDTDLSYIFIYVYELLSGIGWKEPADGQNLLLALWGAYRERYPKLDAYLSDWTFDFAQQHSLSHQVPDGCPLCMDQASVKADILIDGCSASIPLKLPFDLIDALCDYALAKSKFYLDGHAHLMREAIPRVVALADAALRKKGKKGILAVYGPRRTKRQEHIMYPGALCPGANQKIEINVKAYTSSAQLRSYMNELVRYGENVLRELNGCRGRLRGITLDEETAALVNSFLKKEYGQKKTIQTSVHTERHISLDFTSIEALREQSDQVREALRVEEVQPAKPLLTDMKEVAAIYQTLSAQGKQLIRNIGTAGWEMAAPADGTAMDEINREARRILGCSILHIEHDLLIAEDDYRDELAEVLSWPEEASGGAAAENAGNEPMQEFLASLSAEQRQTLSILLYSQQISADLEQLAEQSLTLPQMLLDDLNEMALNSIGEIIIDTLGDIPCILQEYLEPLKNADKSEYAGSMPPKDEGPGHQTEG